MGMFNLDFEEAKAASERSARFDGLKPIGLYKVQIEMVHFLVPKTGTTPCFSFQLDILGRLNDKGDSFLVKGKKPQYAGGKLFFKAFVSANAIFNLETVMTASGVEVDIESVVEDLNGITSEDEAIEWAESWMDTETEFTVYVGHDTTGEFPSERVHFNLPRKS